MYFLFLEQLVPAHLDMIRRFRASSLNHATLLRSSHRLFPSCMGAAAVLSNRSFWSSRALPTGSSSFSFRREFTTTEREARGVPGNPPEKAVNEAEELEFGQEHTVLGELDRDKWDRFKEDLERIGAVQTHFGTDYVDQAVYIYELRGTEITVHIFDYLDEMVFQTTEEIARELGWKFDKRNKRYMTRKAVAALKRQAEEKKRRESANSSDLE
ncbi:hypothetical protein QOT17_002767 [Balamuthia mandrillaris]